MLFVINKSEFQHAIAIVRDDRSKRTQGLNGSFMRLEAKGEQIAMEVFGSVSQDSCDGL